MNPTEIRAQPFVLRPFAATDAPEFAAAVRESMDTVGVWMSWASANYTSEQALAWFAMCDEERSNGTSDEFGIFDAEGRLVGGAGLNQFNIPHGFCNLGYWVRDSAQRQGAATAAVQAIVRLAFERHALSRVEIVVASGNEIGRAVVIKAGATYECLAANRLRLWGKPVAAHVYALIPPPLD